MRLTDVVDIEGMFRLIESIPSKKAEPIKLQLAHLGKERIDEEYDPEITINRALDAYRRKGYSSAESSVIKGSSIAKNAKEQIEHETGKKVVTSERHINTKQLRQQKPIDKVGRLCVLTMQRPTNI